MVLLCFIGSVCLAWGLIYALHQGANLTKTERDEIFILLMLGSICSLVALGGWLFSC